MKHTSLLLPLLAGVLALTARADEIKRISLDGAPGQPAPAQEEGKDSIARIKHVDQALLEIFPAGAKPSPKGTLLVFPGGGYSILAVTHEGRAIAKMLNAAGWDAAVLLYHVSEGDATRDLAIADAKKALELVQKRGAEFGLASKQIGVMGFSAGGHLAARLGHEATQHPPQFLVLMYPAYLAAEEKLAAEITPPKLPIFIYVAGNDKWSVGARMYAEECKKEGIRCEIYVPATGGHGFGLKDPLPAGVEDWPDKLRAFLGTVAK